MRRASGLTEAQALSSVEGGVDERVDVARRRHTVAQRRRDDVDVLAKRPAQLIDDGAGLSRRHTAAALELALQHTKVALHADDLIDREATARHVEPLPRRRVHTELLQRRVELLVHLTRRDVFDLLATVVAHALDRTSATGALKVSRRRVRVVDEAMRDAVPEPGQLLVDALMRHAQDARLVL